jgi:hypothetical protein
MKVQREERLWRLKDDYCLEMNFDKKFEYEVGWRPSVIIPAPKDDKSIHREVKERKVILEKGRKRDLTMMKRKMTLRRGSSREKRVLRTSSQT